MAPLTFYPLSARAEWMDGARAMNGTYLVLVNSELEAEKTFEVVGEDVDENAESEETARAQAGPTP